MLAHVRVNAVKVVLRSPALPASLQHYCRHVVESTTVIDIAMSDTKQWPSVIISS